MPITDLHKKKLKKNLTVMGIVVGIIVLLYSVTMIKIGTAESAELPSCGPASSYDLSTEATPGNCDIYTRQLAYREEAVKLRKQIYERGENFAAPTVAARKAYLEKLDDLHASIGEKPSDNTGDNKAETP